MKEYRYFDNNKKSIDFEGMLEDLNSAEKGSFIEL